MNEYEEIIARFLADMAGVDAPTSAYLGAMEEAAAQIDSAIDGARDDLKGKIE